MCDYNHHWSSLFYSATFALGFIPYFIFIGLTVSATLFEIGFNDWIAKVMFEVHNELV